jgi:hypothetical protein
MDHRLMMGMFIGGVVMMAPPVLLGIGLGVYLLRQHRRAAVPAPLPARAGTEREGAT